VGTESTLSVFRTMLVMYMGRLPEWHTQEDHQQQQRQEMFCSHMSKQKSHDIQITISTDKPASALTTSAKLIGTVMNLNCRVF